MTTPQQDQLIARIENDFSYHQPKSPEIATLLDQIRDDFKELALSLVDRTTCPNCGLSFSDGVAPLPPSRPQTERSNPSGRSTR